MSAFDDALDALYEDPNLGIDIVWTPVGGAAFALRALPMLGDRIASPDVAFGSMNTAVKRLRVRVSEVAARAPGVAPLKNDTVAIGADAFVINGAPRKEDARRLQWTMEVG